MNGPTITQLRELMKAREENTKAAAAHERAKQHKAVMEAEVAEAIEGASIKGELKVDLGPPYGVQGFKPNKTIYANIYNEYDFEEWARKKGFAKDMLSEPKPRKKAVNAFVKRALIIGEALPDGVEKGETPYVTVSDRNPKT